MKSYLDCYPCFFKQAINTSRMISSEDEMIWQILNKISLAIPRIPYGASPPEIGREVYRIISEETGIRDPFRTKKQECIQKALSLYSDLQDKIKNSKDRLMTAIRLSIAGNVIDFGANSSFDLERDIDEILDRKLAINHYEEFCKRLKKADHVFFIADNAGETVFDRLLIEELGKPVIYVVREKPIINDAIHEDAVNSGLDKVATIISSGCDTPGTILEYCSEEFLDYYKSTDFIISKGQGNYEGLSDEDRPIFFLLKAKCRVIAHDIGVKKGSIILA